MDNVCTSSYSYAWYGADQWVQHIDWMALQGVNIFLALTGQEEVQYKVFAEFGLEDGDIREFFNGPAFLTWSRGQSMQSVGASATPEGGTAGLPRSWMQAQWRLQRETILPLTRSLGIVGVLPAFQGNVPPQLQALYPSANMTVLRSDHGNQGNSFKGACGWIASPDPLFGRIADKWMEVLLEDFSTDHYYQCDGFFTGAKPPWYSSSEAPPAVLSEPVQPSKDWAPVWAAAYQGMQRTDPKAHWLYQGWAIRGWRDAAGASRIKALVDSVPHGNLIPLDMAIDGIWRYWGNYSFFNAPFIWTTLHNMGGNDGMKGDMRLLEKIPSDAFAAGATIIGTGATPEGIDQNPAYYEYALDTSWHASAQPIDAWFVQYAARRYGGAGGAAATEAWDLLRTTVYNNQMGGWHDDTGVEWNALSTPPVPSNVNVSALLKVWALLLDVAAEVAPEDMPTLNYDIVNVGREVLAQRISGLNAHLFQAARTKGRAATLEAGAAAIRAYKDLNALLSCEYAFLLGPWIDDARRWANASDGATPAYMEWQARSQVSTWWPVAPSAREDPATFTHLPTLDNYANKHWASLVTDFYSKRCAAPPRAPASAHGSSLQGPVLHRPSVRRHPRCSSAAPVQGVPVLRRRTGDLSRRLPH